MVFRAILQGCFYSLPLVDEESKILKGKYVPPSIWQDQNQYSDSSPKMLLSFQYTISHVSVEAHFFLSFVCFFKRSEYVYF